MSTYCNVSGSRTIRHMSVPQSCIVVQTLLKTWVSHTTALGDMFLPKEKCDLTMEVWFQSFDRIEDRQPYPLTFFILYACLLFT